MLQIIGLKQPQTASEVEIAAAVSQSSKIPEKVPLLLLIVILDPCPLDDDYLTSNSKEFIWFSLGFSGSESLPNIFLAHLWDFLFKFF